MDQLINEFCMLQVEKMKLLNQKLNEMKHPVFTMNTQRNTGVILNNMLIEVSVALDGTIISNSIKIQDLELQQLAIFIIVKNYVRVLLPRSTEDIGLDILSALICEVGSVKRLSSISSSNLKGIGYTKNPFYTQNSYMSSHKSIYIAKSDIRKKNLRKLCNKLAKSLKLDINSKDGSTTESNNKDVNIISSRSNVKSVEESVIVQKKLSRGGRRARNKKKAYLKKLEEQKSQNIFYENLSDDVTGSSSD